MLLGHSRPRLSVGVTAEQGMRPSPPPPPPGTSPLPRPRPALPASPQGLRGSAGPGVFGCDAGADVALTATRLEFGVTVVPPPALRPPVPVNATPPTRLCGGGAGALTIGPGALVRVDTANCSATDTTPWDRDAPVGGGAAHAVGALDLGPAGRLRLCGVARASRPLFAGALGGFRGGYEVASAAPAALNCTDVLVLRVPAGAPCPTAACTATGCPPGHACGCAWRRAAGATDVSAQYCVACYAQMPDDDDGARALRRLRGALALALVGGLGCALAWGRRRRWGRRISFAPHPTVHVYRHSGYAPPPQYSGHTYTAFSPQYTPPACTSPRILASAYSEI